MPRRRRFFESGGIYEICFRARAGLPLPCLMVIKRIIEGCIARTQRDCKVILCHFIWMANHPHLFILAKDARQLMFFYAELQKRITDCLKRLLGLNYLDLWEGRPTVIRIVDLESAKDRLVYLYTNPAKANLVDSIDHYPGYSSWGDFKRAPNKISCRFVYKAPWLRLPSVPRAPKRSLTEIQDKALLAKLDANNKTLLRFSVLPNAWFKCFGIESPQDIAEINRDIFNRIKEREALYRQNRVAEGKKVLGPAKLKQQAIMQPHTPKKHSRKIFVIAKTKELRIAFINAFKELCKKCRACYERWLKADFSIPWPPGTFVPPLPPYANALAQL